MSLLRNALRVNGLFSLLAGLAAVLFATPIAEAMAINSIVLYVVGVGTALFGLSILWATRAPDIDLKFGASVVAADLLWVIGASIVLAVGLVESGWILAAISTPVLVFAILQTAGVVRATRETPGVLATEIEIEAQPEDVWATLSNFDGYATWNPFIREGSGSATEGSRLKLRMTLAGGRSTTVEPTITKADLPHRLEWLGSIGISGVFDGRHQFDLQSSPMGTRLLHREEFSGFLAPLMFNWLEKETEPQFESMNQALKARIEGGVRNSS